MLPKLSYQWMIRGGLTVLLATTCTVAHTQSDVGVPRWVALQRGGDGACEVVYGTAGVRADDRVFGLYASQEEAEAALARHCGGHQTRSTPAVAPTSVAPTPTSGWQRQLTTPTATAPQRPTRTAPPRRRRQPTATATPGWRRDVRPPATATPATQPPSTSASGWQPYPNVGGCIGGSRCGGSASVISLDLAEAPVLGVRWKAHDDVGSLTNGQLRLLIDGQLMAEIERVERIAGWHEIRLDGLRGHQLVIAPGTDDEVVISDISVRYGSGEMEQASWTDFPTAHGCFGGSRCADRGNHVAVALDNRPISGVRLRIHDNVGNNTGAHVQLRIDDVVIAHNLDVERSGSVFQIDLAGVHGQMLVVEALSDDEAVIEELAVRYGVGEHAAGWKSLLTVPQCIGGRHCAEAGSSLRLELDGTPATALRLVIHDRVGSIMDGRLRVTVDSEVLDTISVPDTATAIELGLGNRAAHWLLLEAVSDDEVVLERIEILPRDSRW